MACEADQEPREAVVPLDDRLGVCAARADVASRCAGRTTASTARATTAARCRPTSTVGSRAEIVYDRSKPDGTPRKLLDIGLIRSLGWSPRIALAGGLRSAYRSFLEGQEPG